METMNRRKQIGNLLMAIAGLLLVAMVLVVGWTTVDNVGQFNAFLKGTVTSASIKAQTSTLTGNLARIFYVVLIVVPCAIVLGVTGLILRITAQKKLHQPTPENPR